MDDDPWAGIGDQGEEEDTNPSSEHQDSEERTVEKVEVEVPESPFSEETHDLWLHPFPIEDHFTEESDVLPIKLNAASNFATFFVADERHFQHVKMFNDDDNTISKQTHWAISKQEIVGFRHLNAEHLRAFSSLWSTMFALFFMSAFLTVFSVIEQHLLLLFFFVTGVVPYILMKAQVQWITIYCPRRKYHNLFWIWSHDAYTFRTSMKHFGTMFHRYLEEGVFYSKHCETELSYRPKVEQPTKVVEQIDASPLSNQPAAITPVPQIKASPAQHQVDGPVEPINQSKPQEPTMHDQGLPEEGSRAEHTPSPHVEATPLPQPAGPPVTSNPQPNPPMQPAGPPIGHAQPLPQPPLPLSPPQPVGPPIGTAQPLPQPPVGPPMLPSTAPVQPISLPSPSNAPTIPPPLPPPPLPPVQAISNEEQQALLDELS